MTSAPQGVYINFNGIQADSKQLNFALIASLTSTDLALQNISFESAILMQKHTGDGN